MTKKPFKSWFFLFFGEKALVNRLINEEVL